MTEQVQNRAGFSRDEIFADEGPELLHKGRSFTQPDIFVFKKNGKAYLLKDYRKRSIISRFLFTRYFLRKEYRNLRRLQGIEGIPRIFGLIDQDAFVMEMISGAGRLPASRGISEAEYPPPFLFEEMYRILKDMHAAGLGHGDIRRTNILINAEGKPCFIDFVTARPVSGPFWQPWRRILGRIVVTADNYSMAKIRASFYPELLREAEKKILERPPFYLRLGRFLRKTVYRRFLKPKRWRQRLARWRTNKLEGGSHEEA